MEYKFTPGPWVVIKYLTGYKGDIVKLGVTDQRSADQGLICHDVGGQPNALLISKAPELVEVLEAYMEEVDKVTMNHGFHLALTSRIKANEILKEIKSC